MVIHGSLKRFGPTVFGKCTYLQISTRILVENFKKVDFRKKAEKARVEALLGDTLLYRRSQKFLYTGETVTEHYMIKTDISSKFTIQYPMFNEVS